jgi:hypothetical protein
LRGRCGREQKRQQREESSEAWNHLHIRIPN